MFERELRDLAYVPRWVIARTRRTQSVSEHSFYVALYAMDLARIFRWEGDHARLARRALWHDVDEQITGDTPGPVKREICDKERRRNFIAAEMDRRFDLFRIRAEYSAALKGQHGSDRIIKCADLMDEVAFLSEEFQSGNSAIIGYLENAKDRLKKAWFRLPFDEDALKTEWPHMETKILQQANGYSKMVVNDDDMAV